MSTTAAPAACTQLFEFVVILPGDDGALDHRASICILVSICHVPPCDLREVGMAMRNRGGAPCRSVRKAGGGNGSRVSCHEDKRGGVPLKNTALLALTRELSAVRVTQAREGVLPPRN